MEFENAAALLDAAQQIAEQKAALIADLLARRAQIDEDLTKLGARRVRNRKPQEKRRGRPAGSRNRPVSMPEGVNGATEAGL